MTRTKHKSATASAPHGHGYEFGGPLGAFGITFGLPLVCYAATFLCNDVGGCPVPSLLHPSTLSWEVLKKEAGWPENGLMGLLSIKATSWMLAYYGLSLFLQAFLPGQECEGGQLKSGGKLKYKLNTFNSSVLILVIAGAGTIAQGADFPLWTFMYDNYLQLLSANILICYVLATFVYVKSFSVRPGNTENRELAAGGHTGNMLYDWFIGRELNPRVRIPVIGEIDIKVFCELRPGMFGWILYDLAFIARQYKTYGYVTDSILLVTTFQSLYVFDALWMEPAMLTTMDITSDGFGFMLAFGDLVWVPFTYSFQARYLAVFPFQLGVLGCVGVLSVKAFGYYIFRGSNNEKNRFRTNPDDPKVAHLKYMETKSGSKLLISGWWGTARHINYTGDLIMSWAWCLPTGIAGYIVQHSPPAPAHGAKSFAGGLVGGVPPKTEIVQGEARGWGMVITYFYVVYFAVLLVHREMRDEEKCIRKYGNDWNEYRKKVPYRMLPGIY